MAEDDRYTLQAPNGVAFSDIRGYETWPDVNVSQVEDGLTVARAYVVARAELEDSALQAFVRERLSGHKVPRVVSFVDELPKTPSGKIDRRALRETEVAA